MFFFHFSLVSRNVLIKSKNLKQEVTNLLHGVEHVGKFWTEILNTYEFHPSRTAVDLKDKYKRMMVRIGRIFIRIELILFCSFCWFIELANFKPRYCIRIS